MRQTLRRQMGRDLLIEEDKDRVERWVFFVHFAFLFLEQLPLFVKQFGGRVDFLRGPIDTVNFPAQGEEAQNGKPVCRSVFLGNPSIDRIRRCSFQCFPLSLLTADHRMVVGDYGTAIRLFVPLERRLDEGDFGTFEDIARFEATFVQIRHVLQVSVQPHFLHASR